MNIIAKTDEGFLIQATKYEVKEILHAITGEKVETEDIGIGRKIPAIDYASTIKQIKKLKTSYEFNHLCNHTKAFYESVQALKETVEKASDIENSLA